MAAATISLPLVHPEIAAGTVCAGGAAFSLTTKRMTSSVGLFLPNDPSFGNGDVGRRQFGVSRMLAASENELRILWSRTAHP